MCGQEGKPRKSESFKIQKCTTQSFLKQYSPARLRSEMMIKLKVAQTFFLSLIRVHLSQIPLSHFSREEVSTWSALNSPRVVELFGAVREGLNVVLFMDLKPGKVSINNK